MADSPLSPQEIQRYQRHLQLPQFGEAGQLKLRQARVLIVGVGGLGCPAAQYLAAAGVGAITLVDGDTVSLSNLQRQILFTEADIGLPKALVAKTRLQQLNSNIDIVAIEEGLSLHNAQELISNCDLILDCTDNFATRYLINDLCSVFGKTWIYASVLGFVGQMAVLNPGHCCIRCVFPEVTDVPDCNQAGVLGVVPGNMGLFQATAAIKFLANLDGQSTNQLLQFDALSYRASQYQLQQDPNCPVCSKDLSLGDLHAMHQASTNSRNGNNLLESHAITAQEFEIYKVRGDVELIDVREPNEHEAFNVGGRNIPVQSCLDWQGWQQNTTYVLYCQSGLRSASILKQLLNHQATRNLTLKTLAGGVAALS